MDLSILYAVAGKTAPKSEPPTVPVDEASEERAAIMEYEASLSYEDAEILACADLGSDHPAWHQLAEACKGLDLDPETAWERLGEDCVDLVRGDIPPELLAAFCKALADTLTRERGERPAHYTQTVECDGCGPVWLWVGTPDRVPSCPWCHNRLRKLPIPRPAPSDHS